MSYNGWSNYQTWCANLWIDNDEYLYNHWRRMAQESWNDSESGLHSTREDNAIRTLADSLQSWIEEQASESVGSSGMLSDLLTSAVGMVDCREIAEHWIADVDKEEEEEEEEE